MNKLDELLASEAGREALLDAVPLLFSHDPERKGEAASIEDVPLDRIAWSTKHRNSMLPEDVVSNLQHRVELYRVSIDGDQLYLTANGNHRIERFVEAGRETVPAKVLDFDLAPAVLRMGIQQDLTRGYMLEKPAPKNSLSNPSSDVTPEQASVFLSLGVVEDETVPAPPPRHRRIFGFGIGD